MRRPIWSDTDAFVHFGLGVRLKVCRCWVKCYRTIANHSHNIRKSLLTFTPGSGLDRMRVLNRGGLDAAEPVQ